MLIPKGNEKDLAEIPANVKQKLKIHPVKWIEEVFALALERSPVPLTDAEDMPIPVIKIEPMDTPRLMAH